ncbi:MAG TPA: DUF692 family protein, partial [Sphingomonadales bacterium]|nr:DUF692 family protein [Sphingomonadales bacterium]
MTIVHTEIGQPSGPIPAFAGVGLKGPHVAEVMSAKPALGWFEIHAENYMGPDHLGLDAVLKLRAGYPFSVHGVGLSLGSVEPLDRAHLKRFAALVSRLDP